MSAEQAFVLSPPALSASKTEEKQLSLNWQIAPGYYLYRNQIRIRDALGQRLNTEIPQGKMLTDAFFGQVQVFHRQLQVQASLHWLALPPSVQLGPVALSSMALMVFAALFASQWWAKRQQRRNGQPMESVLLRATLAGLLGARLAYADAHGKNSDQLGIAALQRIPLSARDALANNLSLMNSMGLRATLATIWKSAQGLVQTRTGMPPGLLNHVMGLATDKTALN